MAAIGMAVWVAVLLGLAQVSEAQTETTITTTSTTTSTTPTIPLELELADEPDGPALADAGVTLTVANGFVRTSRTLFLRAANAGEDHVASEAIALFVDIEGVSVEVTTRPDMDLATALGAGKIVVVTLTATVDPAATSTPTTWAGHVFTEADGSVARVAPLVVSYAPAPSVRVAGAADGKLAVGTSSPELDTTIQVDIGPVAVEDLDVAVDDLRSPTNRIVELEPPEAGYPSGPHDAGTRVVIPLQATLDEVGAHIAVVTLRDGGRTLATVDLTVTRTRGPADVEVDDAIRARHAGGLFRGLWGDDEADVAYEVENLSGAPLTLARPALVNLVRVEGDSLDEQPDQYQVTVDMLAPAMGPHATVDGAVDIPGDRTTTFVLRIEGVTRAGTYTGTIRLRQPGGEAKTTSLVLLVRQPRLWMVVLVLAGALISYGLRVVVRQRRERIATRQQVAQLRLAFVDVRDALTDRDERVEAVIDAVGRDVATLADRSDISLDDGAISLVKKKMLVLPRWARLHRRIVVFEDAPPDADKLDVGEHRRTADRIEEHLQHQPTLEELDADLAKIPIVLDQIEAARKAKLKSLVEKLGEMVERDADPHRTTIAAPARQAQIGQLRSEVAAAIGALEAGDYALAVQEYESARQGYLRAASANLRELRNWARPDWFAQAQWDALAQIVAELLDSSGGGTTAHRVSTASTRILETFSSTLVEAVQERHREWADQIRRDDDPNNTAPKEVLDEDRAEGGVYHRLRQLHETTIPQLEDDLNNGRYGAAHKKLNEAMAEFESIPKNWSETRTAAPKGVPRASVAPGVDAVPPPPKPPPKTEGLLTPAAVLRDLRSLRDETRQLDNWVLGAAIFVSLLIGNLVLYNSTWGTANDFVTAVLWGLGIHIGANYTFGGILALSQQMEGATSHVGDGS